MGFYIQQHEFYCGIDLHSTRMYVCIVDAQGDVVFHKNLKAQAEPFTKLMERFQDKDIVIAVESTFNWYWLADLCQELKLNFVLGHALGMKAIHGGKTKNDKQDSMKIAMLLRGGNLPQAYVYPKAMRGQRDLARRRSYFVRRRAELQTHIRNTAMQHNLKLPSGSLRSLCNQEGIAEAFEDDAAAISIHADLHQINSLSRQIKLIERSLLKMARVENPQTFYRLKSTPGIGDVLALVILYEIGDIARFPSVGDFLSYARLVPGKHESNGKQYGSPGRKQGNPHLKWAFSEAVALLLRDCDAAKEIQKKWELRYGRPKTLAILAARLGRAVFLILRRGDVFDERKFLQVTKSDLDLVESGKPKRKRRRRRSKKNASKKESATTQPN
jgi:transposase